MENSRKKVLEVTNLKKYFPVKDSLGRVKNQVKAVDDVSITVKEGETLGLVGETGCGKSTLGRTVLRLIEPDAGKIELLGEDITKISEKELRKHREQMQIVFQDPYTSLNPRVRIGKALEEILTIHGQKEGRKEKVLEILKQVGLTEEMYERYPHEFSGGQRQRIGMARALILNPKLIVCDEPVSALDVSVQAQVLNLMKKVQREQGFAYLFISHDISVIRYMSDRIAVMYLGHVVEEADTEELMKNPLHPYTKSMLSAVPFMDPHQKNDRIVLQGEVPSPMDPPQGCVFHTRCPYATERCRTECPKLKEVGNHHRVCCHLEEKQI